MKSKHINGDNGILKLAMSNVERIFIYTYILYRALYTLSYPVSIAYSTHIPMVARARI